MSGTEHATPEEPAKIGQGETVEDLDVPGDQLDDVAGGARKAGGKQEDY